MAITSRPVSNYEHLQKSIKSKVDNSILNKERYYISGHDVIFFHDKLKDSRLSLDFNFILKTSNS